MLSRVQGTRGARGDEVAVSGQRDKQGKPGLSDLTKGQWFKERTHFTTWCASASSSLGGMKSHRVHTACSSRDTVSPMISSGQAATGVPWRSPKGGDGAPRPVGAGHQEPRAGKESDARAGLCRVPFSLSQEQFRGRLGGGGSRCLSDTFPSELVLAGRVTGNAPAGDGKASCGVGEAPLGWPWECRGSTVPLHPKSREVAIS